MKIWVDKGYSYREKTRPSVAKVMRLVKYHKSFGCPLAIYRISFVHRDNVESGGGAQ